MCITPEHFPANSFIVMVLEKMEEKIGHDGSNYEINFSRSKSHMPHKAHFPKNIDVSDALGRVLMTINMIYGNQDDERAEEDIDFLRNSFSIFNGTKDEDEECFVFGKNKALFNFKQSVKILEEEVEEFVVLNVSPKEFFNIKPN